MKKQSNNFLVEVAKSTLKTHPLYFTIDSEIARIIGYCVREVIESHFDQMLKSNEVAMLIREGIKGKIIVTTKQELEKAIKSEVNAYKKKLKKKKSNG